MRIPSLTKIRTEWYRLISACYASGNKAGQIRARQVATIVRLGPYMMSANVICACMVCAIFWNTGHNLFLMAWSLVIPFAAWIGIRSYLLSQVSNARRTVSVRGINRVSTFAFMTGLIWGGVTIVLFPGASASEQVFLTCLAAGMLCGTGFALATIPVASAAAVSPIAIGSIVALVLDHNQLWLVNCALVIIYTGAILLTAALQGQNFINQLVTQDKIEDQSDTIQLLLNEYEDNSSDWLWQTDRHGKLVVAPKRMAEILCQPPDSLLSHKLGELFPVLQSDVSDESQASLNQLRSKLDNGEPFRDLVVLTSIEDQRKWISLSGRPLIDRYGAVSGYRGVGSDVTTEKSAEARLEHLARNDSLTGVVNRMHFRDLLSTEIMKSRQSEQELAVLSLDLDEFKLVNDTRGHPFGDSLLRSVAKRLVKQVGRDGLVARIGGDEFAILLRSNKAPHDASDLAQRLVSSFATPFDIDGARVRTSTSIGISIAPKHGQDVDSIMKNTDLALYEAKKAGRNRYRLYEPNMGRHLRLSRRLEADLKEALRNNQLSLYYQPLVNSGDRKI